MSSSSYILLDLISPETILQNRQSIISVFVLKLLSFLTLHGIFFEGFPVVYIVNRIGSQIILEIYFLAVYIQSKLLCVMTNRFYEPKVAAKVVVTNPSLKMDNSVEGHLLRIGQSLK